MTDKTITICNNFSRYCVVVVVLCILYFSSSCISFCPSVFLTFTFSDAQVKGLSVLIPWACAWEACLVIPLTLFDNQQKHAKKS